MIHPMSVNVNTRMRWTGMKSIPCLMHTANARVLDLAAGLGFFSVELAKQGNIVLATDIHEQSLDYLRKSYGLQTQVLDLEADTYPKGPFDIVLLCEVLEHLHSPENVVAKAATALAPGGTLVMTTPAMEGPLIHTPGKELGHHHGTEKHERDGFTKKELEDMARQAGLNIRGHRYCIFYGAELFMQATKLVYLLKKKEYSGQGDVVATMNSPFYKILRLIYPALHLGFLLEDAICNIFGAKGNCHIVWAEKAC